MPEEKKYYLTEEQKKFLARPMLRFEPKSPEELAAEKKAAEEKETREAVQKKIREIANRKSGDTMPDGTIYLGFYNNKDWFVAADPAREASLNEFVKGKKLFMSFNGAATHTRNLKDHGHDDWILPDRNILREMFNNKNAGAFQGTYDERLADDALWYWSSTPTVSAPYDSIAWAIRFSDGENADYFKDHVQLSFRPVRAVPRP